MTQNARPYKEYHPILRKFAEVVFGIMILVAMYIGYLYFVSKKAEQLIFQERQKKAQHILIDKIGKNEVWMIIYDGDTLGIVSSSQ